MRNTVVRAAPSRHRRLGHLALGACSVALFACRPAADTTPPPAAPPPVAPAPVVPPISNDPVVQRVFELGTTDSQVQNHLHHLTQQIGPRLTSSHGLMQAEAWARDQFASWGLDARLEEWGEFPVGFDRGPWSGRIVSSPEIALDFTTRAWTPGVHGPALGKAVLYPATVKEAKSRAKKDEFRDGWVVVPKTKRGEGPDEKTRDKIGEVLRDGGFHGYVRSDRDSKGELVHTGGSYRISWDDLPQDVNITLRGDQHAEIIKRIEANQPVDLEFSIDNRFFRGPVKLNNVIADIPGTEKPNEYVIFGGHIDSWDGAQGSVDNATGVATALEAARLLALAGARPKRTIRFMLWSGEEQGLMGSRGYVEKHKDELANISAVLVHDGGTNYVSGLSVTPEMMEQMRWVFDPVTRMAPETMPFQLYVTEALRGGGSDHSPFIRAGVPGFFWQQAGRSNYRCLHHTQYDNFGAAVPEYQQHSAMVIAIAAWNLANLPTPVDRTNSAPIERAEMGIDLDGLKVTEVKKGGKAKLAGWRKGDVIAEIDGKKIEGRRDLWRAMRSDAVKREVKLTRGKRTITTTLDYSEDPATAARQKRKLEREQRFGPEVMNGPKPQGGIYASPELTCRPGPDGIPPAVPPEPAQPAATPPAAQPVATQPAQPAQPVATQPVAAQPASPKAAAPNPGH